MCYTTLRHVRLVCNQILSQESQRIGHGPIALFSQIRLRLRVRRGSASAKPRKRSNQWVPCTAAQPLRGLQAQPGRGNRGAWGGGMGLRPPVSRLWPPPLSGSTRSRPAVGALDESGPDHHEMLPRADFVQPQHPLHFREISPAYLVFSSSLYLNYSTFSLIMPQTSSNVFRNPSIFKFASRRSVVHSTEGIVACTQPLAAKCGLDVLRAGGNAVVSTLNLESQCDLYLCS